MSSEIKGAICDVDGDHRQVIRFGNHDITMIFGLERERGNGRVYGDTIFLGDRYFTVTACNKPVDRRIQNHGAAGCSHQLIGGYLADKITYGTGGVQYHVTAGASIDLPCQDRPGHSPQFDGVQSGTD